MLKYGTWLACALVAMSSYARAQTAFGLNSQNQLVRFDLSSPGTLQSALFIQGLSANEKLVAIDFRPSNNDLYGVGSLNQLYQINITTARATRVGNAFNAPLNGTEFDMDFNAVTDQITLVSDLGQSMFISPTNGSSSLTPTLGSGSGANLYGIAYSNSFPGAQTSTLYGLGISAAFTGTQYELNLAAGSLTSLGNSGTGGDTLVGGFDITRDGVGYAVSTFLDTGSLSHTSVLSRFTPGVANSATMIGRIGSAGPLPESLRVRDIAIPGIPGPSTAALIVAAAMLRSRRRA
jgi:hypothetical protein